MTAVLAVLGVAVVVLLVVTLRLARRRPAAQSEPAAQSGERAAPTVVPPETNVAVVTLYELWMRRVEQEKLGARDETWLDLTGTPQYATWRRLAEARGAGGDVQHYMTRGLLSEVLYAAGGVERELQRLRKALDQKALHDAEPVPGPYAAARPVREASYGFVNLLSWARSTVDRTDRPYKLGSSGRVGLLPALRQGELRDSVAAALQHLRAALRDSRALSSYAFHVGAVPDEEAPGRGILPDAANLAPPAYPLTNPALAGEKALEFTEDRDMLTYATELMAAIEVFVNQVLDAFASQAASP